MAKISTVNTTGMRTVAGDIEQMANDYTQQVTALYSVGQELDALWEGDANAAFMAQLGQDQPRFDALNTVVRQYIEALRRSAESYVKGEEHHIQILSKKG